MSNPTILQQRVFDYANQVFKDKTLAKRWLETFNQELKDSPTNTIKTDRGCEKVLDILGRIEYGVYS